MFWLLVQWDEQALSVSPWNAIAATAGGSGLEAEPSGSRSPEKKMGLWLLLNRIAKKWLQALFPKNYVDEKNSAGPDSCS